MCSHATVRFFCKHPPHLFQSLHLGESFVRRYHVFGSNAPRPSLRPFASSIHDEGAATACSICNPFGFPFSLGLSLARSDSLRPCSFATILFALPSLVFSLPPIVLVFIPSLLLPLLVVPSHLPRLLLSFFLGVRVGVGGALLLSIFNLTISCYFILISISFQPIPLVHHRRSNRRKNNACACGCTRRNENPFVCTCICRPNNNACACGCTCWNENPLI